MTDANKKAEQIEADLKAADKQRADDAAEAAAFPAKMMATLEKISKRLDMLEDAKADASDEVENDIERDEDGTPKPKMKPNGKTPGSPVSRADAATAERERGAALARAQGLCDTAASAHGQRANPPMMAERVEDYRRRLLRSHQPNSADYRNIDLATVSGELLDVIEKRIYADSIEASKHPFVEENQLIERVTVDEAGRKIRSFYGHPRAWMDQFAGAQLRLTAINTRPRD